MEKVRVDKESLVETLRYNKEAHVQEYTTALEKYREAVAKELSKRLRVVKNGDDFNLRFNLPEPVDYSEEFEETIQMLEWETSPEITLSERDFKRFVLNKWEWSEIFAASTRSYLG